MNYCNCSLLSIQIRLECTKEASSGHLLQRQILELQVCTYSICIIGLELVYKNVPILYEEVSMYEYFIDDYTHNESQY